MTDITLQEQLDTLSNDLLDTATWCRRLEQQTGIHVATWRSRLTHCSHGTPPTEMLHLRLDKILVLWKADTVLYESALYGQPQKEPPQVNYQSGEQLKQTVDKIEQALENFLSIREVLKEFHAAGYKIPYRRLRSRCNANYSGKKKIQTVLIQFKGLKRYFVSQEETDRILQAHKEEFVKQIDWKKIDLDKLPGFMRPDSIP